MSVLYLILTVIFALLYLLYYYVTKNYNYWKKRNVHHPKPLPLFGNYRDYVLLKKYPPLITDEICQKFPNEPYVGVYYGTDPALIIKDPNLIKLVMMKDFYYFNSREVTKYTDRELITQNMFFTGGDRWKVLRQNLTSMFTSSKIKNMFYLIDNCATSLGNTLTRELEEKKIIEIKSLLARYTMDCIGSCAFGVDTKTLEENSKVNPFTIMGEKLFDVSAYGGFRLVTRALWPAFFYKFGFQLFESGINDFFKKLLTDVFESRQYKESSRNDFVDLILGWKKKNFLVGDSIVNMKTDEKKTVALDVDDNLLLGQCILFFAAGFETTSTTTSLTLYELSKNQEAQTRVLEEVDEYFQKNDGKMHYECINETPYLLACIEETLRMYPVLGVLTREVEEEYTLPTGLSLEKDLRIHIPVHHLHHNPEHFPEPEVYRPERFFGEERKNIKPFTYMPFGEGPRTCIGLRFAKMPMTAGLLTIFRKYRVELADDMPKTVEFQPRALVTQPIGGVHLKFIPRT